MLQWPQQQADPYAQYQQYAQPPMQQQSQQQQPPPVRPFLPNVNVHTRCCNVIAKATKVHLEHKTICSHKFQTWLETCIFLKYVAGHVTMRLLHAT